MSSLSGPEQAPRAGRAQRLLVLLHGYGADADDLARLFPLLAEALPHTHLLALNAPDRNEMGVGRQWFSLARYDPAALRQNPHQLQALDRQWREQAAPVATQVNSTVDHTLAELGLGRRSLVLLGFSQGGMVALTAMLQRPCEAVLGFSTYLPGATTPDQLPRPAWPTPVFLAHGAMDPVVPHPALDHTRQALATLGVEAATLTRPDLGHGIDPESLEAALAFLTEIKE